MESFTTRFWSLTCSVCISSTKNGKKKKRHQNSNTVIEGKNSNYEPKSLCLKSMTLSSSREINWKWEKRFMYTAVARLSCTLSNGTAEIGKKIIITHRNSDIISSVPSKWIVCHNHLNWNVWSSNIFQEWG